MLKNAKIRTKILLAFGLVIVLSVGIIVGLLIQMTNIAQTTQRLYDQPYTASNAMWTIRRNMVDTERVLYRLMNTDETQRVAALKDAQATLTSDTNDIKTAIATIEGLLSETDQDMWAQVEEITADVTKGAPVLEEITALIGKGELDQATALLTGTFEPLFNSCNSHVLELFDLVEADAARFTASANTSSRISIIVGMLVLALGVSAALVVASVFAKGIVTPIRQLEQAANEMSKGNLKAVDLVTYQSRNEIGQLADSLRTTMTTLNAYVDEISAVLLRLSGGDLTMPGEQITEFLGDFSQIKRSLVTILKRFNTTLGEIHEASEQVDNGSGQVSSAAQLLSQGATEQAAAVEELTATVEEISVQIRDTANNAQSANHLTDKVSAEVRESSHYMHELNGAMTDISSASQEIGKIIKTIEDIAFQTNILALNAAVEAARAGAAGKGFAVVADEVRNLASKSAEASKNTSSLIESSARAVERGAAITAATATSLETVSATTGQVVETVTRIAEASAQQATSVENITTRVEQISTVVQTNSATAEESAAASEELSGQAALLQEQVARFQLFHK